MPKDELRMLIDDLEEDMKKAASELDFERAAKLRDQLIVIKGVANWYLLKNGLLWFESKTKKWFLIIYYLEFTNSWFINL